jgi:glucose-6-phosphate isomerase
MSAIDRSAAWRALAAHQRAVAPLEMRDLFAADPGRFGRFSLRFGDLLLDYSKNRVTDETMTLLRALADAAGLEAWIARLFAGERVNVTENRAALHVALRQRTAAARLVDGVDVMPAIGDSLRRMGALVEAVRAGDWRGHTGKPITAVVNLGIGGSDLGPRLACAALAAPGQPAIACHFVANVDGSDLAGTLAGLDPAQTIVIVTSKTFTTVETLTNAASARAWLVAALGDDRCLARHFVAVSANPAAVGRFGIPPGNTFAFWDWVGGRYSLWSAVGLPVALQIGMAAFESMLDGAAAVDRHFQTAPWAENLPVTLALLGVWYINFFGAATHAVLPYDERLRHLPAYLRQLDMESNGKSVDRDGAAVDYATAPVIWGDTGTNGQHAFFQLLHQGRQMVPADFIAAAEPAHHLPRHHDILVANFLAQTEALMLGRSEAEARAELAAQGLSGAALAAMLPHRVFPGNRPSNSLLMRRLDPYSFGALLALYEHKVFVQGVIWGVPSFDQWGVELGKQLAARLLPEIEGAKPLAGHDSSTLGLARHYLALRKKN